MTDNYEGVPEWYREFSDEERMQLRRAYNRMEGCLAEYPINFAAWFVEAANYYRVLLGQIPGYEVYFMTVFGMVDNLLKSCNYDDEALNRFFEQNHIFLDESFPLSDGRTVVGNSYAECLYYCDAAPVNYMMRWVRVGDDI